MLGVNDIAPDFTLPRDGGGTISLAALRPAPVVLFFYPRDDTPGCTTEAQAFSAFAQDFTALGINLMGISKDSVAKHDKFRDKYGLLVPLLSDAEAQTCENYGVWKEKNMYGKQFFGIVRSTFLIDGQGRIAAIWPKVKVPGHAEAVLAAVKAL